MTPADSKYVRCTICGTWRYPGATRRDDSSPEGLAVDRCKDEKWCEREAAKKLAEATP